MELILHRRFLGKDYTIGSLYLSRNDLSPSPSPQGRGADSQERVTDSQERVPDLQRRGADSQERIPDSQERVPDSQERIPDLQRRGADSQERVPDSQGRVTDSQERVTDSQERVPDLQSPVLPPPLWGGVGGEVLEGRGEYFCDTFEDVDRGLSQSTPLDEIRKTKIPHETAIPTGVYKVVVNLSPAKKRILPRLLDVPGFSGILIHRGNTKHDSSGCILVGENKVKGRLINSTYYEQRLVEILCEVQEQGEEIRITIINKTAESEKPETE